MNKYYYLLLLFILPVIGLSQEDGAKVFSLQEAIAYAKIHNYDYINAQTDIEIAKKQVWETTAIGLPQIDGAISNENYIDIPVTLVPAQMFNPAAAEDEYMEMKFGTKHNASASLSVNQLLFSGEYIVGLQASKAFLGQTEKQKVQTEVILVEQVSKSYFLILSLTDNLRVLDSSLVLNTQLFEETKAMFQTGFVEDTDVDQLDVIVSNLEATIRNIENQRTTAIAYLKFYLGLSPESEVTLTDNIEEVLNQMNIDYLLQSKFDENENIEFLVFMQQKELAGLQLKRDQSQYLPSINAFFSTQSNAMRDTYNFFNTDLPWYPTTVWGLKMNIPIFSSGKRMAVVSQSKLNLKKLEENEKQLSTSLHLQVQTARNNFSNKYYEYLNRKKNLELTVKIYQKTQLKYKEGMASSFDLNQSQNGFVQANTDYTLSIMDLLQNKIELEKYLTKTASLFE